MSNGYCKIIFKKKYFVKFEYLKDSTDIEIEERRNAQSMIHSYCNN